jgi:hypothetical protein
VSEKKEKRAKGWIIDDSFCREGDPIKKKWEKECNSLENKEAIVFDQ